MARYGRTKTFHDELNSKLPAVTAVSTSLLLVHSRRVQSTAPLISRPITSLQQLQVLMNVVQSANRKPASWTAISFVRNESTRLVHAGVRIGRDLLYQFESEIRNSCIHFENW